MMSGVKNLKQAVMPIIWLNCIFCMGIFEIPINHPRYFLSIFYVISIMTGYFIIFYKGIHIFQQAFAFEFIIFHFVLGVHVLVAVLAIILFWWKSENMTNIIKSNAIADHTLNTLGIKMEYEKTSRNILNFVAIWSVCTITVNILYIIWLYHDIGCWITLYSCICICFPITINSVVELTFASLICIKTRFQKTNILINDVMLCANKSHAFKIRNKHGNTSITFIMVNYKIHKDKIMHLIRTLRHLHLEITKTGRQINHIYCLQLLLELAVHFTIVTSSIYCLYLTYSGQLRMVSNEKIIALAIWASIYSIKIILMNALCTNVSSEAYKTIHQFTQQIMLRSLNFTAFGFFSINNSLTGKFFATVTTYVVILIQINFVPNTIRTTK
ncbi:GR68A protein, partial [Acromyrmex charruanus]